LHDPGQPDAAERELRRDPRVARHGHPRVAAAADRRRVGRPRRPGPPAVAHAEALRADGPRARPAQRRARPPPGEHPPDDPQLPPPRRGARRQGRPARDARRRVQPRLPRDRLAGRRAAGVAAAAARDARRDGHGAGDPEPAAAVLARRAPDGARPAPGGPRPRGRHAAADDVARGREPAAERARLQPARRGGGLPVLDGVGEPRRRVRVRPAGRARGDPPRARRDVVLVARAAAEHRPREPGARDARHPAEPAGDERRLPGVVRGAEHDAAGRDRARPAPPEGGRLMQKQAPSVGRVMVMAGFALSCFGLILFLWLAFGGPIPLQPKGYRFVVSFKEAGQLAQEADVRISGVSVGKVKTIDPDPQTGLSDATIEIDERYAPVPSDTRAMLRQKTLLGETYVELTPGSASAPKLPEGGALPEGQVAPTVELDEIFRAFDAPTRDAFRSWMDQLAVASQGRGADVNAALGELAPFAVDTNTLLRILNAQQPTVRRLVADTGTVFDALSERDDQLRRLIENSNRVFATTAARNRELADTFRVLPTFERESTLTVNRLAAFARTANPLVTQLRPAARQLSPTLEETAALAPDLKALFENLDPLIDASERGLPALTRFNDELHPLLGETDEPLR